MKEKENKKKIVRGNSGLPFHFLSGVLSKAAKELLSCICGCKLVYVYFTFMLMYLKSSSSDCSHRFYFVSIAGTNRLLFKRLFHISGYTGHGLFFSVKSYQQAT